MGIKKVKKIAVLILCFCLCSTYAISEAKDKKTSGKDWNGNSWIYDEESKTLTFSGDGSISDFDLDGHSDEPDWYVWCDNAENIVVEEGITAIGEMAFFNFINVKSVNLPETVKKIKYSAFRDNITLKTINFPDNLQYIGSYAFSGCEKMKLPDVPDNIKKIGKCAFESCENIKEFVFPNKVKQINEEVLSSNSELSCVKLSDEVKTIMGGAFYNCKKLKQLDIPKSVTRVAMSAFAGSGIKRIVLPQNVKRIDNGDYGNKVFKQKRGLLPTKNLDVIEIYSKKIKKIEKNSFGGLSHSVVIKVPKSKLKKYTKLLRDSGLSRKIRIKTLK